MRIPETLAALSSAQPRTSLHERLGYRLAALAARVPSTAHTVADIGSDHAQLPAALLNAGRVERAFAVDIHPGPIEKMRERHARGELPAQLQIVEGDGLNTLRDQTIDTLTIAGMGGRTIVRILDKATLNRCGVQTIVLQPLDNHHLVFHHLDTLGFSHHGAHLVAERRRLYLLITATRASEMRASSCTSPTPTVQHYVPQLSDSLGGVLTQHWLAEQQEHWSRVALNADVARLSTAVLRELGATLARGDS